MIVKSEESLSTVNEKVLWQKVIFFKGRDEIISGLCSADCDDRGLAVES